MLLKLLLGFHLISSVQLGSTTRSNIILLITDDQDLILRGLTPMTKTQKLVANMGVTFTNAFATTPICCPSRASILSGLYQHNHETMNNSLDGGCSGAYWQHQIEPKNWPTLIHQAGYTTFYAGKYLNQYGTKHTGGVEHVPPGWDWWIGLVGNSRYYDYTLSVNGTAEYHSNDYLTDVIKEYGLEFLHQRHVIDKNFLMVLAPPAPHAPFTPASKYKDYYKNVTAMRTPNFNVPVYQDKHWLLRMSPSPLPEAMLPELDRIYRQRWETLLSVDDMVEAIVNELHTLGLLKDTHIIVTSDHGYHVGQFGLPLDKRQPYEMDIRVPLLIRGPGFPRKQLNTQPILNIDFAPTFLTMVGLEIPQWMDGVSFFPLNQGYENKAERLFLIEYQGEGSSNTVSPSCPYSEDNTLSNCVPEEMCKCQDSKNNTYTCLRHFHISDRLHIQTRTDFIYCKFKDSENYVEAYDLNIDPFQLKNLASSLNSDSHNMYATWIEQLRTCVGAACHTVV